MVEYLIVLILTFLLILITLFVFWGGGELSLQGKIKVQK